MKNDCFIVPSGDLWQFLLFSDHMGMSPHQRMSHPPGQMQSPLNHSITDLNVSHRLVRHGWNG